MNTTRMNSFGQPMQGTKIRGAGALARARGHAYGRLTSQQRGDYGSQRAFEADMIEKTEKQREEALREKGRQEVRKPAPAPPVTSPAMTAPPLGQGATPVARLKDRLRQVTGDVPVLGAGQDSADGMMRSPSAEASAQKWTRLPTVDRESPRVNWNMKPYTPGKLAEIRKQQAARGQRPLRGAGEVGR